MVVAMPPSFAMYLNPGWGSNPSQDTHNKTCAHVCTTRSSERMVSSIVCTQDGCRCTHVSSNLHMHSAVPHRQRHTVIHPPTHLVVPSITAVWAVGPGAVNELLL